MDVQLQNHSIFKTEELICMLQLLYSERKESAHTVDPPAKIRNSQLHYEPFPSFHQVSD
jgi:hypothetical protein